MAKRNTPKDPNTPKKWPTANYGIGYARPPQHGKIKPGEIRNPWGAKGKPKNEKIDPFEFAASQLTTININGEKMTVTAEMAAHIVNMSKAVAGDARAHRNVVEERRHRKRSEPIMTAEDIKQEMESQKARERLTASIISMLDKVAAERHNRTRTEPDPEDK